MSAASEAARAMQRLSAASRWGGKSAEQKRAAMSALAKARWAKKKRSKTKARGLRQNADLSDGAAPFARRTGSAAEIPQNPNKTA